MIDVVICATAPLILNTFLVNRLSERTTITDPRRSQREADSTPRQVGLQIGRCDSAMYLDSDISSQIQLPSPLNTSYINYIHKSLRRAPPRKTNKTKTITKMTTDNPHPRTPSEEQQKNEALAAFTATLHSVGTNLETPLRDRAAIITSNAAALEKQEAELAESTARLARQNARWVGLADETRDGLKEIGDVQNWAEMIERDLAMLEEVVDAVDARGREGDVEVESEDGGVDVDRRENGGLDVKMKKKDGDAPVRQGGWLRWW